METMLGVSGKQIIVIDKFPTDVRKEVVKVSISVGLSEQLLLQNNALHNRLFNENLNV